MDQGTHFAHFPSSDGGPDPFAADAIRVGSSLRGSVAFSTALESAKTPCLDPRPTSSVLETSSEVFASLVCPERHAKTSPNQIPHRLPHYSGSIKY